MVVLHIGAIEDQLFLWGEFSLNEEEQGTTIAPSSTEKHPDLPRQASVEELRSALTEAGLSPDVGEAVQLTIWLPSIEGVPVPSSSLIAEIPQKQAKPELVAWRIPAFPYQSKTPPYSWEPAWTEKCWLPGSYRVVT